MRDVAALAAVGLSTVSRVVNGDRRVHPARAARVREAVALLGYRHDLTASSLRRADRSSATIGLIFDDVSNPFFAAVQRAVEDVARDRGVLTFTGSSDERPERERRLVEELAARRVDGLVIAPSGSDHSYLHRDLDDGIALVFVDRPPRVIDADAVVTDNVGGAHAAVAHLAARGHRRIGYVGDRPELFTGEQRLAGYRRGLAHHGLPEHDGMVRYPTGPDFEPYGAVRELLEQAAPPTALFTSQNLITIAAIRALHDLGLQHAIAHVGFDDVALADVVEPAVTVVAQDPAEVGSRAVELLFARLDGDRAPTRRVVVPTRMLERGSGEIAAPA